MLFSHNNYPFPELFHHATQKLCTHQIITSIPLPTPMVITSIKKGFFSESFVVVR